VIIKHLYVLYRTFGIIYDKNGDMCLDFGSGNLNNRNVSSKMNGREKEWKYTHARSWEHWTREEAGPDGAVVKL